MEIKSSLLNEKSLALVKDSLIKISQKDGKEKFRVKMLEYINDISDNDDDEFFFDMIEFIRFLDPSSDSIAYTTPAHLIFMNAPNSNVGESVRKWDFVYDHECLHQLWDTFGVGDKLKKNGIKYNHYVLNIASDCVINDYLARIRKKEMPDNLITPEYLKENFGVEYDPKKDTQYTLYLKLLEVAEKLKKDKRCQDQCGDSQEGGESGESGDSQSGSSSGQSGNNKSSNNGENGEKGDEKGDNKSGNDKEDKEGEEGEKSEEGEKGDQESNDDEGEESNSKSSNKNSKNDKNGKPSQGKSGNSDGTTSGENEESDVDLADLKKRAEEIINKYKNKISGDLGKFIKQCQVAASLKETGMVVQTPKGASMWNKELDGYVLSYVKDRVFKKHREYQHTYKRLKRGSGFIKWGEPIKKGKKVKDDKMTLNVAFYVDRSGSMTGVIDKVFDAAYIISEALSDQFSRDKVIDDVAFKMFTFDDVIEEIEWGKKVQPRGGNLSMEKYLKEIETRTGDYLINVFITDGEFSVSQSTVIDFLDKLEGCFIYVTNTPSECSTAMKKISKTHSTKLFYIDADKNFTIE